LPAKDKGIENSEADRCRVYLDRAPLEKDKGEGDSHKGSCEEH